MLISRFKIDVNEPNDDGKPPVLLACRHGIFRMVIKLAAAGARADIANKLGEMPLHWVINILDEPVDLGPRGHPNALELVIMALINRGGSLNAKAKIALYNKGGDFFNKLHWAAGTTLHRAVSRCNLAAARYLLKMCAKPLGSDGTPEILTPLDLTAHHHHMPMLKLLMD
jgi:ankyrin repeat protein